MLGPPERPLHCRGVGQAERAPSPGHWAAGAPPAHLVSPLRGARLTELTSGPRASRGAKAVASDGVTGRPALAVTPPTAGLSEGAGLTPWWAQRAQRPLPSHTQAGPGRGVGWEHAGCGALTPLAELAVEASGAETLAADGVTGGPPLTLTQPLAAGPVEPGGTGWGRPGERACLSVPE